MTPTDIQRKIHCPECNKILIYRYLSDGWYCVRCDIFYEHEEDEEKEGNHES